VGHFFFFLSLRSKPAKSDLDSGNYLLFTSRLGQLVRRAARHERQTNLAVVVPLSGLEHRDRKKSRSARKSASPYHSFPLSSFVSFVVKGLFF
jgi:hypothetical protein